MHKSKGEMVQGFVPQYSVKEALIVGWRERKRL